MLVAQQIGFGRREVPQQAATAPAVPSAATAARTAPASSRPRARSCSSSAVFGMVGPVPLLTQLRQPLRRSARRRRRWLRPGRARRPARPAWARAGARRNCAGPAAFRRPACCPSRWRAAATGPSSAPAIRSSCENSSSSRRRTRGAAPASRARAALSPGSSTGALARQLLAQRAGESAAAAARSSAHGHRAAVGWRRRNPADRARPSRPARRTLRCRPARATAAAGCARAGCAVVTPGPKSYSVARAGLSGARPAQPASASREQHRARSRQPTARVIWPAPGAAKPGSPGPGTIGPGAEDQRLRVVVDVVHRATELAHRARGVLGHAIDARQGRRVERVGGMRQRLGALGQPVDRAVLVVQPARGLAEVGGGLARPRRRSCEPSAARSTLPPAPGSTRLAIVASSALCQPARIGRRSAQVVQRARRSGFWLSSPSSWLTRAGDLLHLRPGSPRRGRPAWPAGRA